MGRLLRARPLCGWRAARRGCTPRPPRGGRRARRGRRQWQVPQEELAQEEQFLVAPLPPRFDDDECTANVDSKRQTSPEWHFGHSGLAPLRTSSSKRSEERRVGKE